MKPLNQQQRFIWGMIPLLVLAFLLAYAFQSCEKEETQTQTLKQAEIKTLKAAHEINCETDCINPSDPVYFEKHATKTITWTAQGKKSKTVEIAYFNTLTHFILRVKSSNGWSDLIVNGESVWTGGPVAANTWGEYAVELPEGWEACEDYGFLLMIAGNGPVASFNVEYNLIGPCQYSGITVATNPAGRTITVDGRTYTAPQTFTWVIGSSHTIGTISPQGTGGTRYAFQNWSDGGVVSHSITVPEGSTTYTANFTTQYLLATSVSPSAGGSITANPTSADGYYNSGTSVELKAEIASGYVFSTWTGDLSGTTNPQSIVLNAPRSVTAEFSVSTEDHPPYVKHPIEDLLVRKGAPDQMIDLSTVFADDDPNDVVIYSVISNTNDQVVEATITGNILTLNFSDVNIGQSEVVVAASSNGKEISSKFLVEIAIPTFDCCLTKLASPSSGGYVIANPASSFFCYGYGTIVELTAVAASGYVFSHWTGDIAGTTNPQSIDMGGGDKSVTAEFSLITADHPPYVKNPIEDVYVALGAPDQTIDLSNVFADDDLGDALSFKVISAYTYSSPRQVYATITGTILTLDFTDNLGYDEIVVVAYSNGQAAVALFKAYVGN